MAVIRLHCFSATSSILFGFLVFVEATSAQVTFNRQWRRGQYQGEGKLDDMESDQITFNRATRSELTQVIIPKLVNFPTSIILSSDVFGERWEVPERIPSILKELSIQRIPIYWKLIRNDVPLRLSQTNF